MELTQANQITVSIFQKKMLTYSLSTPLSKNWNKLSLEIINHKFCYQKQIIYTIIFFYKVKKKVTKIDLSVSKVLYITLGEYKIQHQKTTEAGEKRFMNCLRDCYGPWHSIITFTYFGQWNCLMKQSRNLTVKINIQNNK